jgi:hypothetical protein
MDVYLVKSVADGQQKGEDVDAKVLWKFIKIVAIVK